MIKAFKALSGTKKVLWGLGVFLAPLFIIGAVSPTPDMQKAAQINRATDTAVLAPEIVEAPTPEAQVLKAETKLVNETTTVPYQSTTREDSSLEAGKTVIAVAGVNGEKTITYYVTYTSGTETGRTPVSETIIKQPITEVKKVGTKPKALLGPRPISRDNVCGYSDACAPGVTDSECKDGSGNGTSFVLKSVRILGLDFYKSDSDNDSCD